VYAQACDADSCILAARGHGERAGRLRARVESGVAARRDSCRVRCRRVRTAPCGARWACHDRSRCARLHRWPAEGSLRASSRAWTGGRYRMPCPTQIY